VIADLLEREVPLPQAELPAAQTILALAPSARRHQPTFEQTGGVHAASLFRPDGEWIETFEDVGRHNAVDKVIGSYLWHHGSSPQGLVLSVSGRASFEIVQKAIVARCRAVVSVSAPSSLAVATARRFRLGLVGFARGESFNVYAGPGLWETHSGSAFEETE
jgi:FdhD protein